MFQHGLTPRPRAPITAIVRISGHVLLIAVQLSGLPLDGVHEMLIDFAQTLLPDVARMGWMTDMLHFWEDQVRKHGLV